jgi:hypothetical protein
VHRAMNPAERCPKPERTCRVKASQAAVSPIAYARVRIARPNGNANKAGWLAIWPPALKLGGDVNRSPLRAYKRALVAALKSPRTACSRAGSQDGADR